MMFKRNDGYALSYVLVVLLVLCIIAVSVMSAPLRNLQMQQASIARMQEKYAAQGMIEQVVAQLEHADAELSADTICNLAEGIEDNGDSSYTITAETDNCTVTAVIQLNENRSLIPPVGGDESDDPEGSEGEETETQFDSYTVSYESYTISYKSSVGGST